MISAARAIVDHPQTYTETPLAHSWCGRVVVFVITESARRICEIFYTISTLISALIATIKALLSAGPFTIKELQNSEDERACQTQVAALEKKATYPLGPNESFKIDHGADYFAFFKRLGQLSYYTAFREEELVAVGCGVLRDLALKPDQPKEKCWYLCDLKVDPASRGQHIPLYMFMKAAYKAWTSTRGYAISMNPTGSENRVVKMFRNHGWIPVDEPKQLALFSMNQDEMQRAEHTLEKHRGPVSYLSLQGTKDLILSSTGQPLPLLHAQFGPCKDANPTYELPQPGFTHMFVAPVGDALYQELISLNIQPSTTASIISRGMKECDWSFILTSDI